MKIPSTTLWIKNKRTKMVRKVRTSKKMRVLYFFQKGIEPNSLFKVKVQYSKRRSNRTDWQPLKETKHAFMAFIEKELINEFC